MPEESSADSLNSTANHPEGVTPERAANIEREAGFNIALAGGKLPDDATDAAREGYDSVPDADRGHSEAAKTDDKPTPEATTIQGGDINEKPPAGMTNPPVPTAEVVHRPITKANLYDHAEAVADAVHGLENRLTELGLADGEEGPESKDFADLPDDQKVARVAEAAIYVGNAVLGKPDTDAFRPNVLWAIARALRPKLVIRHRGVTPEV